ncbi:sensor domain-containing diguanylate cyclase [Piscinibacter aquaticus]|uniref:Sensor domain-containing diguanylate cyclase n=1 Tax=Piscinibacter aquaticus TaxID=392597 RepID=A0A5C6U3I5_9BURK|nr:sensor domain-containing diguanylate cyclase [Piscinibacter aquaticus]
MAALPALPELPSAIADLLDILPDAVVAVDACGRIAYVNPAIRNLLGYLRDELIGQPLSALVPPGGARAPRGTGRRLPAVGRADDDGLAAGAARRASQRSTGAGIDLAVQPALGRGDVVSVAVVHDISLLHTHLDRATLQAQTDALTGLGNRLMLSRQMQANLENGRPFSLLLMDLTGFKALNDRYGHAAGDEALRVVGQRLLSVVRESDVAARLGGDEFVLLLDGLSGLDALEDRALGVAESLARPLRLDGVTVVLGVNIGGAAYPTHGDTESAMLGAADRAMYAAKRAGEPYRSAV